LRTQKETNAVRKEATFSLLFQREKGKLEKRLVKKSPSFSWLNKKNLTISRKIRRDLELS